MKIKRILPILFFSILAAGSMSCSDDVTLANEQEVYFEVHYSNQAWGKQFRGFLIDKEGQVRTYDMPAGWNDADVKPTFTKDEMEGNLSKTKISSTKIASAELDKNISAAQKITGDNFSKPVNGGADMGLVRFYAYSYDANNRTYRSVLLRQTGDVIINNLDTNAKEVADWLTKVVDDVY
ncbi:hypothetical protein GCM10010967_24840 [Dyadobacter beijingensis]|uniref:PsbP protein n=1 Tax=Dyadobacter beijingensis TaxID=365489 RepID=A0ABQ2HX67_9BACT|nr:hypothetical protein [Dyadobacter beijingensis]GGM90794.1 hypothetical protein GCM10010967_24840 [Dyadobacter beijingensis]